MCVYDILCDICKIKEYKYKGDEIISGECPNGENLEYTHIQNNKDSFGYYDIDALIKICEQ